MNWLIGECFQRFERTCSAWTRLVNTVCLWTFCQWTGTDTSSSRAGGSVSGVQTPSSLADSTFILILLPRVWSLFTCTLFHLLEFLFEILFLSFHFLIVWLYSLCHNPIDFSSGAHWMKSTISFHKLKLTNNVNDPNDHVCSFLIILSVYLIFHFSVKFQFMMLMRNDYPMFKIILVDNIEFDASLSSSNSRDRNERKPFYSECTDGDPKWWAALL